MLRTIVVNGVYFLCRNFWGLKRHFPDLADSIYANVDPSIQKALDREQDLMATNGTGSMSASLRGSNSSLNSMPGSVISMCRLYVYVVVLYCLLLCVAIFSGFDFVTFCFSSCAADAAILSFFSCLDKIYAKENNK